MIKKSSGETKDKHVWKQTLNAQNLPLISNHEGLLSQPLPKPPLSSKRSVSRFTFLAQVWTHFLQAHFKASVDEQKRLRSLIPPEHPGVTIRRVFLAKGAQPSLPVTFQRIMKSVAMQVTLCEVKENSPKDLTLDSSKGGFFGGLSWSLVFKFSSDTGSRRDENLTSTGNLSP